MLRSERFCLTFKCESVYDDTNKNSVRGEKPIHLFAVFIVKKITTSALLNEVYSNHLVTEESGKSFVLGVFKVESSEPNLGVPEMKVTNKDPITYQVIRRPGRVSIVDKGCTVQPYSAFLS